MADLAVLFGCSVIARSEAEAPPPDSATQGLALARTP